MRIIGKIALASVSMLSLAAPAYAAGAAGAEEEVTADTIVVEARRKDENIQDVPLTVNAVSSQTLEKLNIRDFKDISSVVPGLTLNAGNNVTGSASSLRGLNVDVNASGNNGTVEFYLNDAPISAGVVLQSMFDIGQIEVLRGPQGTLRGRASPSGSITVTTKRPDMEAFGGYAQGTVNDIGTTNLQGAVNIPIVKDMLAIRVAGLVEDSDANRVTSQINPSYGPSSKTRAVRVSLRVKPVDNLEINASYGHLVKNYFIYDQVESAALATNGTVVGTLLTAADRKSMLNVPRNNHQAFDIFNWQARYSFLGQRLDYVGSVTKQDLISLDPQDKGDRFDSTYPGDASVATVNASTYSANLQNLYSYQHSYPKQQTHELRLSSEERVAGMFDYVIGGMISKLDTPTDLNSFRAAAFNGTVSPTTFLSVVSGPLARRGRTLEKSVFGNLTAHIAEKAEISGGVRHVNYQENTNGPNNSYNKWIWSASAKYRFSDDVMAYASAGSSFRLGSGSTPLILARSISLTNIVDPLLASMAVNNPETSKSYEIGLKTSFLDKKVTFNIAAFHQDFSGYIFSTAPVYVIPNTGTSTTTLVAGVPTRTISGLVVPVPAKVDGVEAELSFRPSSNFSIGANLAYAKSKMNAQIPCTPSGTAGPVPTVAEIQQGNANQQVARCTVNQSAARTAPFSGNLQAEYNMPVSDGINGFVRTLVNFNGDSKNDPTNLLDDVSSYALVNLYLGVRSANGAWEVTAYAKNLTNTLRVISRDSSATGVTTNLGTVLSNYRLISTTDPREFGITARFAFGSR